MDAYGEDADDPTPGRPAPGEPDPTGQAAPSPGSAIPGQPSLGSAIPGSAVLGSTGPGSIPPPARTLGIAGLSLRYQMVAALALAGVLVVACVHVLMVFLHVAPPNTMTKEHGQVVDDWVYPEFEQNWKLFAPNPLQQNVAVQARAQVHTDEGTTSTTGWYDLSAMDGAAIDGNLLPSHTQQNALRRAWDFYVASHDAQNRPTGTRGELSERYIRRIALLRLDRERAGGPGCVVERLQLRSRTTQVRPPEWSQEKTVADPVVRELPWWPVTPQDIPLGRGDGTKSGSCSPAPALDAGPR